MNEKFYPSEDNLGKDCKFWQGISSTDEKKMAHIAIGCFFPKYEMEGRASCEGIVDDVCLYLKDGRQAPSLTQEQTAEIRHRIPDGENRNLPPGDIH